MVSEHTRSKPAAGSTRLPRRLPQPIRNILWFTSIGAVVGAAYGHMMAVAAGRALLGVGGLPRGVLAGVVITGILSTFEQILAGPAMARLRATPFLVHLAIKTVILNPAVGFGLPARFCGSSQPWRGFRRSRGAAAGRVGDPSDSV